MLKKTLKNKAYTEIKERIVNSVLLPGARISDNKIATELGISRAPVREALIRLSGEGIVQNIPNCGFRVKVFTLKEIADLYSLRENLELFAIQLATPLLNEDSIRDLYSLMEEYPDIIKKEDLENFNRVDEEFHSKIVQFSENSFLENTFRNLQVQIRIIRRYQHLTPNSLIETYDDHTLIMKHMIRGEIAAAQEVMSNHIMVSVKTVMTIMRESIR